MHDELRCPNCRFECFDTDWMYENDMWNPNEDERRIKCTSCKKDFMFKIFSTVGYSCCTIEDYEEVGMD